MPECILPPWYGLWITPGAILLSATVAGIFAYVSIRATHVIARRRATLDLIHQRELDTDYIKARREFIKLRDAPNGLLQYANGDKRDAPEVAYVRTVLNGHELAAIGIKQKIIDEKLYRLGFESTVFKDWRKAKAFVEHLRDVDHMPKAYIELQWLVRRWGGE